MAVTTAGNAIRMTANGDTTATIARGLYCKKVVLFNSGAGDFSILLRKGTSTGKIILEAKVSAAVGTMYLEDVSVPEPGFYLEIVAGTGSVTLLSE